MKNLKQTNKDVTLVIVLLISASFIFSNIQSDSSTLTGNTIGTAEAPAGDDHIGEVRIYEVTYVDKDGKSQTKIGFNEAGESIGTGKPDADAKGDWYSKCSTLTNEGTKITSMGDGSSQKKADEDCHKKLLRQKKIKDKAEAKAKSK